MSTRMTWEERQAIRNSDSKVSRNRPDLPAHLVTGASTGTRRALKPRRTVAGVMGTSPYWHSMVSIDSRWDK